MEKPYRYDGIAELKRMMFLSYGGKRLDRLLDNLTGKDKLLIAEQLDKSTKVIHGLRVLHTDLELRNMLWDEHRQQLMVIDFERAQHDKGKHGRNKAIRGQMRIRAREESCSQRAAPIVLTGLLRGRSTSGSKPVSLTERYLHGARTW
ncbi:hypothetical protein E8E11_001206 [Didymella keratinophila]|nr:hypothetical protein E8E11_001206 [Didymella keratinophila]